MRHHGLVVFCVLVLLSGWAHVGFAAEPVRVELAPEDRAESAQQRESASEATEVVLNPREYWRRELRAPLTTSAPVAGRLARGPEGALYSLRYGTALFLPEPAPSHVLAMAVFLEERALVMERSAAGQRRGGFVFVGVGAGIVAISAALMVKVYVNHKDCMYYCHANANTLYLLSGGLMSVGGGLAISSLAFFMKGRKRARIATAYRNESELLRGIEWELTPSFSSHGGGGELRLRF